MGKYGSCWKLIIKNAKVQNIDDKEVTDLKEVVQNAVDILDTKIGNLKIEDRGLFR